MKTVYHNLQLISGGTIARGKAIIIDGDKITDIIDESTIPQDANRIDLQGANVAPGLIDLQIYGSGGKLFGGKPEVEALAQMESDLLSQGTVGFFATIATNSDEIFEKGIEAAKAYREQAKGNFLGLHLEGPFLNAARRGAHPEKYIKKATLELVERWINRADGVIKMMTIAPELQDDAVVNYLNDHGVILSSGHSNATYQQGKSFLSNPVKAVTHLYNAMPSMPLICISLMTSCGRDTSR